MPRPANAVGLDTPRDGRVAGGTGAGSAADDLVASWSFELPAAAIAQRPLPDPQSARMLVVSGGAMRHAAIRDLPGELHPGDLLVVNDTRVLAARLFARRATGGRVEIVLAGPRPEGWAALVRPSAKLADGERVVLVDRAGQGGPAITIGARLPGGLRLLPDPLDEATLARWGELPLPPYIERQDGPDAADRSRYQTLFAAVPGALAAPTAGLHFDADLRARLDQRGVGFAAITLHVGAGTFAPVRAERLSEHAMHAEPWRLPPESAAAIDATERAGGRVIAVGTTSFRALEAWERGGRPVDGAWRTTDLLVWPGDPPRKERGLLTNFHLPGSTLLPLVAALPGVGRQRLLHLYAEAIRQGYRFYSYGDAMLFL